MMTDVTFQPASAFCRYERVCRGALVDVALALKALSEADPDAQLLVFDDSTGAVIDLDLRGDAEEIVARLTPVEPPRGRGRPRLGVVPREVTLLPRQWDWLAGQPGGASATLRRLVDAARRSDSPDRRLAKAAAYRFMAAIAGDLPGFEEATRSLFADDRAGFAKHASTWPADVCAHVEEMAWERAAAAD